MSKQCAYKSTRVVTEGQIKTRYVVVEHGRITAVQESEPDCDVIDFGHDYILPGMIDTHVHINEPGRTEWEGFETATRAAAAGGVTTVIDMPLNCLPETTTVHALDIKLRAAKGKCGVDWTTWGGVVADNQEYIQPLANAGVPGFKCFLVYPGCEGFTMTSEVQLREALPFVAKTGLPLLVHAELAGPIDAALSTLADGDWHKYETYLASRPDEAEIEAIELMIRLSREFGCRIHIVHLSTAKALPMLKAARTEGLPITVETCPHYLHFAAEDIPDGATLFKCAPPIRNTANRELLWEGLRDGIIDFIATDHSPCPPELKREDEGRFDTAWGGIASLSVGLSVIYTEALKRGFSILDVVGWMSATPAKLAGLDTRKGQIAPGFDADFVVFDPDSKWTVTPVRLHFRHPVSPYIGEELTGIVNATYLRGSMIYGPSGFISPPQGRRLNGTARLAAKVMSICRDISKLSENAIGTTRTFLSEPMHDVHKLLGEWMGALDMTVRVDAAGNLRGFYSAQAPNAKRLLIGSHLDTVPNAGAFDGILGVVIGIALVEALGGRRLPIDIEIVGFSEEEGVRFGVPFIGSKALIGELDDELLTRCDASGVSVREAITSFDLDPSRLDDAKLGDGVAGYLEFHIEQGPQLEALDKGLAVVSSIVGQTRLNVKFLGQANHAGTTPMHLRRDALAAASAWILAVESEAKSTPGLVATVGKIAVTPGAENVVPGEALLSLDVRHADDLMRENAVARLTGVANSIAAERLLSVEVAVKHVQPTVPMDPGFIRALSTAISVTDRPIVMASGAGHDAMILAPHVPSGLIFLRSPGGISHHPEEALRQEDVQAALETGMRFLEAMESHFV